MTKKGVLIVDDHALVRAGIRVLVDGFQGFEVLGEATDGHSALVLARSLLPDVVLMDLAMSGLNGLDAAERMLRDLPDCAVVILSMHASEHYVLESLRRGVKAYVLKDAAPACLNEALLSVVVGRRYLSPPLAQQLLSRACESASFEGRERLTARQREILQLIAEGYSSRDIAERLHISVKTVETHRGQLMQRLDIFDVAGLTRYAIRAGLISP